MSPFATAALTLHLLLALLLTPVRATAMVALVPAPTPYGEQHSPRREAITLRSFGNFDDAKAMGSFGNSARAPPRSTPEADHAEFVR